MSAFTYRFAPGMTFLRHLVQTGELGEIRHARFQRLQDWGEHAIGWRQYKAQAGSGELGDMGIHCIDYAEDLLGQIVAVCASMKQVVPRRTTASGQNCAPQDVEDWVAWIAEFESGATGVFEMTKLSKGRGPGGDHDLAELNGSEASALYRGNPVVTFRYDQAWEFVSAIRQQRDATPSFYHGMRAQAVAEGIVEASRERRWVSVWAR